MVMAAVSRRHARLYVTVDLVILTIREEGLHVLLVERGKEPHQGQLALPGGFLRERENLPDAARRELAEETGLSDARLHLEQVATYGDPGRDPRDHVVTVAYLAIAPSLPAPVAGSDARHARWEPVDRVDRLAFDHNDVFADALERARSKLEHGTLATVFCPETFTIGELRRVYEAVWGGPVDARNFNRKVTGTAGFVVPTGETRRSTPGRPAALYRAGPAKTLYPPMLRTNIGMDKD
jgi:8-oxo-dGTP diphosphatase